MVKEELSKKSFGSNESTGHEENVVLNGEGSNDGSDEE
jgi:hypothetical protein